VLFVLPLIFIRRRPQFLLWVLILWCTVLLVLINDLVSGARQLEFLRYTIAASVAVYACIPAVVSELKPKWIRHAVPAAAILSCLGALPATYAQTQTPKPDWREHAALIDRLAQPNDVALFYGASERDPGFTGSHYLALRHYAKKLPRTCIFIARPPDEALLARMRAAGVVWAVIPFEVDFPSNALPGFVVTSRTKVFGLPAVQRWQLIEPPASQASTRPPTRPGDNPGPQSSPDRPDTRAATADAPRSTRTAADSPRPADRSHE